MQRSATPTPILAASIALALVLAGCGPRADGDAGTPATQDATVAAGNDLASPGTAAAPAPAVPPDHDDVRSGVPQGIPLPARDAPTPPLPEATEVAYLCADGSDLRVRYGAGQASVMSGIAAEVVLPLSREASAEHGGEVYTGKGQGLRRIGSVVEFDPGQGEDGIRRCREASSSA